MKRILAVLMTMALLCGISAGDAYQKGSLAISLNAVTASGVGTSFAVPMIGEALPSQTTWQVVSAGANPTAVTVLLEGSLDGTHWFTLDTLAKADTAGTGASGWAANGSDFGELRWFAGRPVRLLRCNATTITRSASETISCSFITTNL